MSSLSYKSIKIIEKIIKNYKKLSLQTWLDFFNFVFWLSLISFLTNFSSFTKILIYSELSWVLLYCFILVEGSINDDLILSSSSIMILGFAGIEYAVGILILVMFKEINKKTNFDEYNETENSKLLNNNSIFVNRYIWNSVKEI